MSPLQPIGPILMVHNHYQNFPHQRGGEDRVFEDEVALLREHGHEVHTYEAHNDDLAHMPALRAGVDTLWNRRIARELAALVRAKGIRIVHFHNTFPRISPAAYGAVRRAGAATVQTLHNYRLLCAGALLYRDGAVCEDCLERPFPWPALVHRCYRDSLPATAAVVAMQMLHRALGTWTQEVDAFIALTHGARDRFIRGGLPAEKIHVLGNFLPEGSLPTPIPPDGHALFLGRLDEAKGIRTLLEAYALAPEGLPDLVVAGDGPLAAEVQAACERDPRIQWWGYCGPERVHEALEGAKVVVIPSNCYEGFPMVLLEAWRAGRPVIASKIGALEELVCAGEDGFLISPVDAQSWCQVLSESCEHLDQLQGAGLVAQKRFDQNYRPCVHHDALVSLYKEVSRNLK
jgi:glycosyltransferase involved in cell wall biosynthesis